MLPTSIRLSSYMQNDRLCAKIFNQIDSFAPSLINFTPNIRINQDYIWYPFGAFARVRWAHVIPISRSFRCRFISSSVHIYNSIILIVRVSKSPVLESMLAIVCYCLCHLILFVRPFRHCVLLKHAAVYRRMAKANGEQRQKYNIWTWYVEWATIAILWPFLNDCGIRATDSLLRSCRILTLQLNFVSFVTIRINSTYFLFRFFFTILLKRPGKKMRSITWT